MKTKLLCIFLIVTALAAAGTYSGGTGTEADPYQISTPADWVEFVDNTEYGSINWWDDISAHYVLTANIDLAGVNLKPAGSFKGVFNGAGHVISNSTINLPNADSIGLFSGVDWDGKILNLGIENIVVTGNALATGGLAGISFGTIEGCYAIGSVAGYDYVGGLVGVNFGDIIRCYTEGWITGSYQVGGLVGGNLVSHSQLWMDGTVQECYSTATVTGENNVGGLVGNNFWDMFRPAQITDSFATGNVSGNEDIGGLTGYNIGVITGCYASGTVDANDMHAGGLTGENDLLIENCYATGPVSGSEAVGGLAGKNRGTITHCYAAGTVTGSGDFVGGLIGYQFQLSDITAPPFDPGNWGDLWSDVFNGDHDITPIAIPLSPVDGFWDRSTTGIDKGTGNPELDPNDVIGLMTSEMQTQSSFTGAGWDFIGETIDGPNDIWFMRNSVEYPRLVSLNREPAAKASNILAYAGPDSIAEAQLNGTDSVDPDGDILEYSWYNDANELIATGAEPNVVFEVGEYEITLIVSDGIEDSEPNSCIVTVIEPLEAEAQLTPQSLNRKSNRPAVIGRLELAGYRIEDIDPNVMMVLMPGNLVADRIDVLPAGKGPDSATLIGFFDNAAFMNAVPNGNIDITLAAKLNSGQWVYGTDTVKVK